MPLNRNAQLRYRTIDRCLRNTYRQWTLDDLIEACCDALYDVEGSTKGISRRTVQLDIQMMRSGKLGYYAPIVVSRHKYYTYSDSTFSISGNPLSEEDVRTLKDAVSMLQSLSGIGRMEGYEDVISKLDDKAAAEMDGEPSVIFFDTNSRLRGLELIPELYGAIRSRKTLRISYRPFRWSHVDSFEFFPYALKQYNLRWFLFGRKSTSGYNISNLALDRIEGISDMCIARYETSPWFNPATWFDNIVGVSKSSPSIPTEKVVIKAGPDDAPYILTKPLHSSQRTTGTFEDGSMTFELEVIPNRELLRLLMGFAGGIEVISPASLREKYILRLQQAISLHSDSPSSISSSSTLTESKSRPFR